MSLSDPKIFVALVCWAVYSFEVFAARRIGWGGRRTAYLSALGFAIVLLNFVPISYFLTNESQLLRLTIAIMHLLLVGISHRTAPVELRERVDFQARGVEAALRALRRARLDARGGRAVDLQPRRALRRLRRRRARRAPISCDFVSEFHGVDRGGARAARLRPGRISTRRAICSASPPASTRWSSASRRFSAR